MSDITTARHLFVINESQSGLDQPPGENPTSIHKRYNFDRCFMGNGRVIAIVGAFNYPTALSDFNVFSKQFGLPLEISTNALAATNLVFQVVNARGTQPPLDAGWAMESALDIQWAHAMAPLAKIVLVQSASNTFIDLFQAIDVANALPNVQVVSMSWGGYEWSGETAFDAHLKKPGITYVAGAGDIGGQTLYPSVSQYVVSVGGTKLNRNQCGKFVSETGWTNSGGGPSIFVPIPAYQAAQPTVAAKCGNYRGTPDVAFDADPASGVAIYDSTPYNGISGWVIIGGTSLGGPCWAGIIACINERRNKPMESTAEFLTLLYGAGGSLNYTKYFNDIIHGKAGAFSCTTGWDFVTGWGSPNIRNLIRYFGGLPPVCVSPVCVIVEKVYDSCQSRECFPNFPVCLPNQGVPAFTFVSVTFLNGVIVPSSIVITPIPTRPNFSRVRFTIQIPYTLTLRDSTGELFTLTGNLPNDKDIILYFPPTRPESDLNLRVETRTEVLTPPLFTSCKIELALGSFIKYKVTGVVQLQIQEFGFCPEPRPCEEIIPCNPCNDFEKKPFPDFFPPQKDTEGPYGPVDLAQGNRYLTPNGAVIT